MAILLIIAFSTDPNAGINKHAPPFVYDASKDKHSDFATDGSVVIYHFPTVTEPTAQPEAKQEVRRAELVKLPDPIPAITSIQ